MFQHACTIVRESLYGCLGKNQDRQNFHWSCGSGFMISPGIIATTAHLLHHHNDLEQTLYPVLQFIRAPDIAGNLGFERAHLIDEDPVRDLALLRIDKPRSDSSVKLENVIVPRGTSCGSLGFPLPETSRRGTTGVHYSAFERFQGGYISNYLRTTKPRELYWYETDYVMYGGSSGCPGFLRNGNVIGMQKGTATPPQGQQGKSESTRISIARWVPSTDIIEFAMNNDIAL